MSQTNKLSEETYETLLNYNIIETEEDDNIYLITEDEVIQNLENKIDNLNETVVTIEEKVNEMATTILQVSAVKRIQSGIVPYGRTSDGYENFQLQSNYPRAFYHIIGLEDVENIDKCVVNISPYQSTNSTAYQYFGILVDNNTLKAYISGSSASSTSSTNSTAYRWEVIEYN